MYNDDMIMWQIYIPHDIMYTMMICSMIMMSINDDKDI